MKNGTESYRKFLINSLETLARCEGELFTNAINVLMAGELNDTNQVFEIGDVYNFQISHLESSDDINVRKIAEVIVFLRTKTESLKNINSITDEEL